MENRMTRADLKAVAVLACLLPGACDQALSAKGPPTVVSREDMKDTCVILIKVDADSNISIHGDTISLNELTSHLKSQAEGASCEAVVQADKDVDADDFAEILKTINAATSQE